MLHGSDASWETFRKSAEVRRDDAYEVLSQHFSAGGGPFGGYHRSCYQTYTNKTLLARLQRDESKAESETWQEGRFRLGDWTGRSRCCANCTVSNVLSWLQCIPYGRDNDETTRAVHLACTTRVRKTEVRTTPVRSQHAVRMPTVRKGQQCE